MPLFQKGRQKTGGRQKGTKNKKNSIVREKLIDITNTDEFWNKFIMELFSLEGREFIHGCKEMFEFVEAKLQAVALDDATDKARSRVMDMIASKKEDQEEEQ